MGLDIDFSKLKAHDVLDLAIFAEREAQDHYELLSTMMRTRGNEHAATFFHRMAGFEKRHHDHLVTRRNALFPGVAPNLADRWFWGIEAPDYSAAAPTISTREAFTFAIDSEVRAHDYYAEAKNFLNEEEVTFLFEQLCLAEAEHERLLRAELAKLPT